MFGDGSLQFHLDKVNSNPIIFIKCEARKVLFDLGRDRISHDTGRTPGYETNLQYTVECGTVLL